MCHAVAQPSHPPQPTYIKTPNSSCCCYLVAKLCLTLCDPLDCSSSIHGISQARILEVGCHFLLPGDLPHPGIKLTSPALAGGFFATSTTWEVHILSIQFSSVAQSCLTLRDPMNPSRPWPPCPSPTPGVHPDSCPSSK